MPIYSYVFSRAGKLDRVTLDMPNGTVAWQEAVKSLSETLYDIDGHLGHDETLELVVRDRDGNAIWQLECRSKCLQDQTSEVLEQFLRGDVALKAKEIAMTENKRETGVRAPKEDHRPSQTDQNAGMPKNPHGSGLSQPPDETNDQTRQSDQAGTMEGSPAGDALGQYARTQHGGDNNGVASAEPVVISGKKSGDATFKHTYKGIDKE